MENVLDLHSRAEFREWLNEYSQTEKECWVALKRGKPVDDTVFYYLDAVEEALCFGWIDSVNKGIDGVRYQRFSPRVKRSPWSELNKERVRRLDKLGLLTPQGKKLLPKNFKKKSVLDPDVIAALKKHRCYKKFKAFPELYQRIRVYNVAFYKRSDPALYQASLKNLIGRTKKGKMFGEWNDYGRLLDY